MKKYKLLYILPAALLFACEPEFDDVDFNGGSANFSTTVAVGNSLMAGFQSNALSAEGQENSLPNMIAQQLKQVGGSDFTQPLIPGEAGILGAGVDLRLYNQNTKFLLPELSLTYNTDCKDAISLGPALLPKGNDTLAPTIILPKARYTSTEFAANISSNGPFNNVAVPGARVGNLNQVGYGSSQGNAYFERFASNPGETMIQAAMKTNHTFFMLWIGNNDVLGYATKGGDEGGDAITSQADFSSNYSEVIDSLRRMDKNIPGIVANIPYVTSIPYFTTVKWNALVLTQEQANSLNTLLAGPYNAALENPAIAAQIGSTAEVNRRKLSFSAGANGFLILDNDLSSAVTDTSGTQLSKWRQIKEGELITLTVSQDDLKCNGLGSVNLSTGVPNPIPGQFVLDADEVSRIKSAVDGFNAVIKAEADAHGLAFVDANARLQELATSGIAIDGVNFTSEFVTGGAFSLDGVHPSTRGYAIIANDFIAAINAKYGANVPSVVVSSYPPVEVE